MLHNTPTIPMESITGPSAGFLDKTHPSISDQWILQPEAVRTFPTIAFKTPSSCQRKLPTQYITLHVGQGWGSYPWVVT